MLYMIGDKIVEITKTNELFSWNRVGTPDLSHVPTIKEFLTSVETEPDRMFESFINLVDTNYYQLMSQTETTEFVYRFFSRVAEANIDGLAQWFVQ